VALKVAKRAVVGDDLEAVAQRLEAAARTMPPVFARSDQLAQKLGAIRGRECADRSQRLLLSGRPGLVQERCDELLFAAVGAQEPDGGRGGGLCLVEPEPRCGCLGGRAAIAQELDPAAAPIGPRHAHDEARDDLLQLFEQ
jgi:hypothetical protein